MENNFGLLKRDMNNVFSVFQNHKELEKAVIFGSRAMGNYKKGSDIDIAIFGNNITFRILSDLNYSLNEEIPVPYFIDVVHFEKIKNEELKNHILQEGKIIYKG